MKAIWRGFHRVAVFSGRDSRDQFWPYAGFVFLLLMVAGAAVWLPMFSQALTRMQAFAAAHPDQAEVVSTPTSYSIQIHGQHPGLFPDFVPAIRGLGAVMAVAVLLWAAAVTRRLHDRGKTALWGLLPLPFLTFSLVMFPTVFSRIAAGDMAVLGLFFTVFFSNMLYLASLARLGFLLIGPSAPEANRFGAPPALRPVATRP